MRSGVHYLIDVRRCDVDDNGCSEALLTALVTQLGLTELRRTRHVFAPQGYTAMVLLSESHISIHTWPERNTACIDIFSCGKDLNVNMIEHIVTGHVNGRVQIRRIERGWYETGV